MTTKTCQHCQDELTNSRAKNCPTCSAIMQNANRYGTYGFVMEAMTTAREDGLTGSDFHNAVKSAAKTGAAKQAEWKASYREYQKKLAAERSAEVRIYQANGYWKNDKIETEDTREEIEEAKNFKPQVRSESELYG